MSATKPPPGYDDRFVVPLEPSRRGAHRARVSPVVGVLPVVAVVAVVVVVIVLAWTLFGRSTGSSGPSTVAGNGTATASQSQTAQVPGNTVSVPATNPGIPEETPSASTGDGAVDKSIGVTVLNSTTRNGLAGRVSNTLVGKGWTGAHFAKTKVTARPTTVYYATADQKALADALVADLGTGTAKRSTAFGSTGITVVLGTDYP